MTEEEIRVAILDALLEFDNLKKQRRLRSLQRALRGTVMATVLGSTGLTAVNGETRSATPNIASSSSSISAAPNDQTQQNATPIRKTRYLLKGAAHFGFNQATLNPENQVRLRLLIDQLPKNAEITVIGRTDSSGMQSYNKRLGKQRAATVAEFLSSNGVKVKSVENRLAKSKRGGWKERRVDILVAEFSESPQPVAAIIPPSPPKPKFDLHKPPQHTAKYPGAKKREELLPAEQETATPTPESITTAMANNIASPVPPEPALAHEKPNPSEVNPQPTTEPLPLTAPVDLTPSKHTNLLPSGKERQKVSGVAHFENLDHQLTRAHTERLMAFINQLPKDAEITVIGRTDPTEKGKVSQLGMKRARNVAIFLANQGVNVKAVGSKVSSGKYSGWLARRVDIVVDSAKAQLPISLPTPEPSESIEHFRLNPVEESQFRNSIKHLNPAHLRKIESKVTNDLENARLRFNGS